MAQGAGAHHFAFGYRKGMTMVPTIMKNMYPTVAHLQQQTCQHCCGLQGIPFPIKKLSS